MKKNYRSILTIFISLLISSFHLFTSFAQTPTCATNFLPTNGGSLANPGTPFTWTAPAGGATGYRIFIGTNGGGVTTPTNVSNGTTAFPGTTYTFTGSLNCGTTYYWQVIPYNDPGDLRPTGCPIQSFTINAPGDPSVFPIGLWNAYCFNSTNYTNYTGYYSSTGQDFDSRVDWNTNYSPSATDGFGAANYQGCSLPIDNHTIIFKREGFTPGTYTIDVLNDDNCIVYVNGVSIYTRNGWTATYINSGWVGDLDASSQVEYRLRESSLASTASLKFIPVTKPTLDGGVISGNQSLCFGNTNPFAFTNTQVAKGSCSAIKYQWQSDVNCTGTFTDISGATTATYDAPAGVTETTCYRRMVLDANCNRSIASNTLTVTVYATPPGDPTVFPIESWNAYCYNSTNWTNYTGYYTATGQDFDSRLSWNTSYSPSASGTNGASTYQGCLIPNDNHSVIYKRQGFTPGTYALNIYSDDACELFLNGVSIYTRGYTGSFINGASILSLDANSKIEFRWTEGGGGSGGAITFVPTVASALMPGSIVGTQSLCFGNTDPSAFTSTAVATGSCGLVSYQWQRDVNCTGMFTDIAGATTATYDAPAGVTETTCYRRKAIDFNCSRSEVSNTITVTVYATPPGDPTNIPLNVWNGYAYTFSPYTSADVDWTNYNGFYTYVNSDPSFNTASIYTIPSIPSSAPGYQGCAVGATSSGVQLKRQGFPTGTYSIDFRCDDAGYLYINGVLKYQRTTAYTASNVWTGNLDGSSIIEFRYKNGAGAAIGALTFNLIPTPILDAGTIAGNQILCPGDNPYPFTSGGLATGSCSPLVYQWQEDVGCTGIFTDIPGANALTYDVAAGIMQSTCYRRAIIDVNCERTYYTNTVTVTVTTVPQGDPSVFPLNSWNGYVYDFSGVGYGGGADVGWTDYKGFFPVGSLSFNTTTLYASNQPPSAATGYTGCQIATAPLTGVQIKRQGFPTGVYQLDFRSDDAGYLYINGILIFGSTGSTNTTNVWIGTLDETSTIDYRYKNNSGSGLGALTFTTFVPTIPLTEGGIALNGPPIICPGDTPTPIVSTSDAASSCYLYYQWQADEGSGFEDILLATSSTFTPASVMVATAYRRKVTDACGDVAYSNVVNINVGPASPPDASIFGAGSWIAYAYNQQNYIPASLFGSYTDPGVSATDPSFNSTNSWANLSSPSLASSYIGCQIGVDNHSVIYKRQGFPTGTYIINVYNDDRCELYIDGVLVYARNNWSPTFVNGVWTGVLDANSKVEFRWTEGVLASVGAVTFLLSPTPGPLDGGIINNATTQVCSGDVPAKFTSSTLPSNGCAIVSYQWQLDTGSGYSDIAAATNITFSPVAQTVATSYRRKTTDACAQIGYSNVFVITIGTPTPPNPAIFGSNKWNVFAYNDRNFTDLRGMYVDNGFSAGDPSFDSRNMWNTNNAPSDASGYMGCNVGDDLHGVIYKRQGFPVGIYRLDYNSDDGGSVYINGNLVYTSTFWGTLVPNIWTGPLDGTSTIEYRWSDAGGPSYGQLTMTHPVTPTTLVAGTISSPSAIVCSGDAPVPFASTADASGGCYKIYQWQSSPDGVTYADISGANAPTFTPAAITVKTYYKRKVADACGTIKYSNVVVINVGVPTPPTVTWGDGKWNAFVYNGRALTTLFGKYIESNTSAVNYSFDTRNSWAIGSRPSIASTYTGCQVGDNLFGISFRQTNFIPGVYQIDFLVDDDVTLIVDGITRYTSPPSSQVNAWTGTLNATSQVEIRYGENTGNAYCKATFTSTTPASLLPGTIGTDQSICTSIVPAAFTSIADATSGCTITYQWQRSTISATGPWTNVGSNSSTYALTPPGQTVNSYYMRIATDACGRSVNSNVITVTVNPKPNNAGAITGLSSVCSGQTGITYTISPVLYATTYNWLVPTGTAITSGAGTNSITVTAGSTSGNITVQPSNACGVGLTSTIALTVTSAIPAAAGSITGPTTVCQAQYNVLYSVAAVPNAVSYIWTVPPGATIISGATTNTPRITFGTTNGNITVTPTNNCGNALTATTLPVTITLTPGAAGAMTGTGTVCPGQTGVAFSISPVAHATTYSWSLPSGSSITSGLGTNSILVTFGSNSGNVTVTPTNSCGTSPASSKLVSVVALGVSGTIAGTSPVCQNSTIIYTTSVVTGASNYAWTVPPGASIVSGNGTRTITVTMGITSGDITVIPSNSCATGTTVTRAISVTNSIPSSATSIVGEVNPCRAQTGVIYSTTSTGATSYAWSLPVGSSITAGINTNAITATIGANSGSITVTPSNVCGNATSASQTITVKPFPAAVGVITGRTSICKGESGIAYSIAPVANALSYNWSVPTGATITSGAGTTSIIVSYLSVSVSSGSVAVTATNTCASTSNSIATSIDNSCSNTWTGTTSTAWNISGNWNLGYIPTSTTNVVIPTTVTSGNMPTISTVASVNVLTNNGSITLAGSGVFNVYGNINSTGTWSSATGSILNLVGASAQTLTGVSSVANITINNTAGVSVATPMTVNGTVSLKAGVLNSNNNVTINFDNGGNIAYDASDAGSIVGTVTGMRNLTYKTHYIAAPFAGVMSAQVQATTPLFVGRYWKMYTKDFVKQNWTAVITTTDGMPLGTGFSLSLPAAAPLKLSGTYNHAYTFSSPLYTNVGTEKYFMIGNPYPSTLDWNNEAGWTKTNIGGSIYYLNAATSQTASYVGGTATNGGTQYIPAMQSFMVLCDGTGGFASVGINNDARISLQNPSFWRVASEDIIRIHLTGENPVLTDEAVIRFNESATNMFDFDLDATKIMNGGKYPSVYTREGSSQYSINSYARPDSAKVIPVLAKLVEDGTYTLRFENTNSSIQYVLIDNQLGVEQPITEPYTFVGTNKDSVNRFELQLRESAVTNPSIPTGLQSSNNTRGMQIYSSVKGFILQSDRFVGEGVDIELMDVTGNSVGTIADKSITSNRTFVPVDLPDGSYIVRVTIGSDVFTGLIVLVK